MSQYTNNNGVPYNGYSAPFVGADENGTGVKTASTVRSIFNACTLVGIVALLFLCGFALYNSGTIIRMLTDHGAAPLSLTSDMQAMQESAQKMHGETMRIMSDLLNGEEQAIHGIDALSKGGGGGNKDGGGLTGNPHPCRPPMSLEPALTPRADLEDAPAGEVHGTYAPHVPPTITRQTQRRVVIRMEAAADTCVLSPHPTDCTDVTCTHHVNTLSSPCNEALPCCTGHGGTPDPSCCGPFQECTHQTHEETHCNLLDTCCIHLGEAPPAACCHDRLTCTHHINTPEDPCDEVDFCCTAPGDEPDEEECCEPYEECRPDLGTPIAGGVMAEQWFLRLKATGNAEPETCTAPGPVLRVRVGDWVEIHLTNNHTVGLIHEHNIDFHAVAGPFGGAGDLTVDEEQDGVLNYATIGFRAMYPGAFLYHCAFGDVPIHMAMGMYGTIIVDPETPLPPVEHEWAVLQSEWYLSPMPDHDMEMKKKRGVMGTEMPAMYEVDCQSLSDETPLLVTLNGRVDALLAAPLVMNVGERARIYMVNAGPNLVSSFHPIGSHWELVYPDGSTHPCNVPRWLSQTTLVPAGGAAVFQVKPLVPETIVILDHSISRAFYKGGAGFISVLGSENLEIYDQGITPAIHPNPRHLCTAGQGHAHE